MSRRNRAIILGKCHRCGGMKPIPMVTPAVIGQPFLCTDCDWWVSQWLAREDMGRSGTIKGHFLLTAARQYLDVPFHHGGMNRFGMDCAGLILASLHDLNWTDWTPPAYGEQVPADRLLAALYRFCDRIDTAQPIPLTNSALTLLQAGDILLFAIKGNPQHLGIANGKGGMVHCPKNQQVMEVPIGENWLRRLVGVYRWRGEAE
jgi:NlpC/P60 family protein